MGSKKKETMEQSVLYRNAMQVKEVLICKGRMYEFNEGNAYPICPRCGISIEYDYQKYCSNCGQKLSWRGYRKARVRFAGEKR